MRKFLLFIFLSLASSPSYALYHCQSSHPKPFLGDAQGTFYNRFLVSFDIDWCAGKKKVNGKYQVYLKYYSDRDGESRKLQWKAISTAPVSKVEKWGAEIHHNPIPSNIDEVVLKTYVYYKKKEGKKYYRWISTRALGLG